MGKIMRVFINIILITIFVLLITAIILLFLADVSFTTAQALDKAYRWKKAEKGYQSSIRFNPFNAVYSAQYGDFLIRQARYKKGSDKILFFEKARKFYYDALRCNPRYAKCYVELGRVDIEAYRNTANISRKLLKDDEINNAINNFKKAIQNDPNGFSTLYSIAYTGINIWDMLDKDEKVFILNIVKYCLSIKPWYGKYIYPHVLNYIKDSDFLHSLVPNSELSLSYNEKEKEKKIKLLRDLAMTEPSEWKGKSRDGTSEYKNGNMYWEGTLNRVINVPEGKIVIKIQAKGDKAYHIWPYMIVELDGEVIGKNFADSYEWKDYGYIANTKGGIKVLSVSFLNDGGNEEKNEDRNLFIGEITIFKIGG